jgi:hypothetical protein
MTLIATKNEIAKATICVLHVLKGYTHLAIKTLLPSSNTWICFAHVNPVTGLISYSGRESQKIYIAGWCDTDP